MYEILPVLITSLVKVGNNVYDGHAWIIDGLVVKEQHYNQRYKWIYYNPIENPDFQMRSGDLKYDILDAESEYPDIYKGMIVEEDAHDDNYYYLMNWGYDGLYDEGIYSSKVDNWTVNGITYNYKMNIFTHFE